MSDVDVKVFKPEEIEEIPFPQEEAKDLSITQSSSGGVYKPAEIKGQIFPTKKIAVELIGSSLNTKSKKILAEFQFTETGALQIGKYINGLQGDIRISPNGITARNAAGITTFALDGETGDAVFAGTIQAGTIIGGNVAVGDSDIQIDGENKRMIFYDENDIPQIIIGNA